MSKVRGKMKRIKKTRVARLVVLVPLVLAFVLVQYVVNAPSSHALSRSINTNQVSLGITSSLYQLEDGDSTSHRSDASANQGSARNNDLTGGYTDFHEGAPGGDPNPYTTNAEADQEPTKCKWYQLGCHIKSIFNGFWNTIWNNVAAAVGNFVAWCFTFWMGVPLTGPLTTYMELGTGTVYNPIEAVVTIPAPGMPNGVAFKISDLLGWVKWFAFVTAIIMMFVYFGRLAWSRQSGQGFEVSKALFWIGIGCGLTGGACALVPAMMTASPAWRGPVGWITQQLWPITAIALVLGLIITGIKVITDQNGKPVKEFIQVTLITLAVANLGGAIVLLLSVVGDELAATFIANSLRCSDDNQSWANTACVGEMIRNTFGSFGPIGWLVILIICLVAFIVSLIQCLVMIARSLMLIFVLGGLTLAAAFRYTKIGKESFEKSLGWIVALLLYKPVVAMIYGIAFKFMGAADVVGGLSYNIAGTGAALRNGLYFIVSGVMAIAALPALMKLVTPAVSAMAEDGGGGMLQTLSSLGQTAMMAGRMAAGDPSAMAQAGGEAAGAIGGGAGGGGGSGSIVPGGGGGGGGESGGGNPLSSVTDTANASTQSLGGGGGESGGGGGGGASGAGGGSSPMQAATGGGGGGGGASGSGGGGLKEAAGAISGAG